MEIRFLDEKDDLFVISNIYESSWKHAYKNIIPQEYLDSIPAGRWAGTVMIHWKNTLLQLSMKLIFPQKNRIIILLMI